MNIAVILAAGLGSRIRKYDAKLPKCLISVAGVPILGRLIENLIDNNIEKIFVVVGYKKEKIIKFVNHNEKYSSFCEIIESKNYGNGPIFTFKDLMDQIKLGSSFLLCPADLIIDINAIKKMITEYENKKIDLLIGIDKSKEKKGTTVKLESIKNNKHHRLIEEFNFHSNKGDKDQNLVPIIISSSKIYKYIDQAIESNQTRVIEAMNLYLNDNNKINFIDLSDYYWFDVDNVKKLKEAERFLLNKME
jgi:NDP-sugar pyrophosphorylase family protein